MNHLYLAAATAQHAPPAAETIGFRLAGVALALAVVRSMFCTFRDRRSARVATPPVEEERFDERYAA